MFLRKIMLSGLICLVVSACHDQRTTLSEVQLTDTLILEGGKPFSGELWSDDDSTWCLTAKNGNPIAFTLYHPNGKPAFVMQSPADTLQAFDETGEAISIDSFAVNYQQLAEQIPALMERFHGTEEQQ